MKKFIALILSLMFVLALVGCDNLAQNSENPSNTLLESELSSNSTTDYPAAIMVAGEVYLLELSTIIEEVDDSSIIGYTTSYTDTFPEKDGETNFNRDLMMPYASVDEGIAVLYDGEWRFCFLKE